MNIARTLNLTPTNYKKWVGNIIKFTAPALAVFFGQLATGVDWKPASAVALLALYGLASDWFKKKK